MIRLGRGSLRVRGQQRADIVVHDRSTGLARDDQHMVAGREQGIHLGDDEGLSLSERQPLGDVHDLHGEVRPAWNQR